MALSGMDYAQDKLQRCTNIDRGHVKTFIGTLQISDMEPI